MFCASQISDGPCSAGSVESWAEFLLGMGIKNVKDLLPVLIPEWSINNYFLVFLRNKYLREKCNCI